MIQKNANEQIGIPRTHPDFIKSRRERFCKLLREAKRTLKFSDEERKAVVELCNLIEKNTRHEPKAEDGKK